MTVLKGLGPRSFSRWPIRWKLAIVSASLTLVILLIFGGIVGTLASNRIRGDFNSELEYVASGLAGRTHILEREFSPSVVTVPNLSAVSLPSGGFARVIDTEGVVREEAPKQQRELGPPRPGVHTVGSLVVATQPVFGAHGEIVGYIQYGRSDSHVDSTVARLWFFIIGGILGGTALAVLAGVAIAGRAMKPIANLTSIAREVATTRDPSKRLPGSTAEDEVAELTKTLQDMLTALEASQVEREEAMQKQREFVADASHELRTPLTSILANLELLEAQLGTVEFGEERELAESAVRSSRRMSRLVADLLVLARSDAGQHRPKELLDLADVAAGAAREITPNLNGRTLDCHCDHAPMNGNRDELHRLVLNLLDNAARYTPQGSQVLLKTEWRREDGTVVLEVADSGPGIPSEMRERVFERFVRGHNSSDTVSSDGTGLGLALVRSIAVAHGGTVAATDSRELSGAHIVVSLPATDARTLDEQRPAVS